MRISFSGTTALPTSSISKVFPNLTPNSTRLENLESWLVTISRGLFLSLDRMLLSHSVQAEAGSMMNGTLGGERGEGQEMHKGRKFRTSFYQCLWDMMYLLNISIFDCKDRYIFHLHINI